MNTQLNRRQHALRPARMENRRPPNPFTNAERIEGLVAYVEESMPAREPMDCEACDIDRLHDEALEMDLTDLGSAELEPWDEPYWERDESYFEGVDESPNMYSPDDHWLPWARSIEEVRDIFGGTDFIIIHSFRA